MPLLTISQSAFDEVARAIREAVPADKHDAYFDGDLIDMDRVVLTTAAEYGRGPGMDAVDQQKKDNETRRAELVAREEARKPPFADYVPSED